MVLRRKDIPPSRADLRSRLEDQSDALEAENPLCALSQTAKQAVSIIFCMNSHITYKKCGTLAGDLFVEDLADFGARFDRLKRLIATEHRLRLAGTNSRAVSLGGQVGDSFVQVAFKHSLAVASAVYFTCGCDGLPFEAPFPSPESIASHIAAIAERLENSLPLRDDMQLLGIEVEKEFQRAIAFDPRREEYSFVASPQDYDILFALSKERTSISQTDLSVSAGCDRKVVGERLALLKEAKLVASPPGKKNLVGITEAGRKFLARLTS